MGRRKQSGMGIHTCERIGEGRFLSVDCMSVVMETNYDLQYVQIPLLAYSSMYVH